MDLPKEFITQNDHVLVVTGQRLLCRVAGIPDARFGHKAEPDLVNDGGFVSLRIGTEENRGAKDSLKSAKQPTVLGAALLHTKGVQHFGCTPEGDRLLLLPDGQSG